MDKSQAKALALQLIETHLAGKGWTFRFNRAKRTLGVCDYDLKTIELSSHWAEVASEHEVRNTILHEIAHALTPDDVGHGDKWKECCLRIGCRPERLTTVPLHLSQFKWAIKCRTCGDLKKLAYRKCTSFHKNFRCTCGGPLYQEQYVTR